MSNITDTYTFTGQEQAYTDYRPNWDLAYAVASLQGAGITQRSDGGWTGTANGQAPVVISIGAGTGADAALFKMLGCKVILVEPNQTFLDIAKANMTTIRGLEAEFRNGNAMNTGIPAGTADLLVIAQAVHTLKQPYAEKYMTQAQKNSGKGTEELSREHWKILLWDKTRACVSIWYYNPDPRLMLTHELHEILFGNCPKYATSKTPLLNAEFFEPNHFQPWISKAEMRISDLIAAQIVSLTRDKIGRWLGSYSFRPEDKEFDRVVGVLQRQWFDKYQESDVVNIPYVGVITQGPLRPDPFPIADIGCRIAVSSPLIVTG